MPLLSDQELKARPEVQEESTEGYQLSTSEKANSDLDNYVDGMSDESSNLHDEDFTVEIPEVTEPEKELSTLEKKAALTSSEFSVKFVYDIIRKGLVVYAKSDDDNLRATPEEIKEIASNFSIYFTEGSFELPPWLMGSVLGGVLLFDKFKIASSLRKANIESEGYRTRVLELERQIDEREKQIKAESLVRKLSEMKQSTKE